VKKKKHNQNLGSRCKRMKRPARLQSAKHWLTKFEGKSLIRGYSQHFGVSHLCAALELRMLGYNISDERIEQYKNEEETKQRKALLAKQERIEKELETDLVESNRWFSFIVGYTSNGVPYGVERENSWDGYEFFLKHQKSEEKEEEDFDLPF